MDPLTAKSLSIMTRPKTDWVALVEAEPPELHEPIKDRIRLLHGGGRRQAAYSVRLSHKRQPIPMSVSEGATLAEAWGIARQVFINYEIISVDRANQ